MNVRRVTLRRSSAFLWLGLALKVTCLGSLSESAKPTFSCRCPSYSETTHAAPPNGEGGDAEKHPYSARSADRGGAQKRPSVERRKVQRMQALIKPAIC